MKIVTIIEDNPITGVRYGAIEVPGYNNNIQRRMERYNRFRKTLKYRAQISQHIKNK